MNLKNIFFATLFLSIITMTDIETSAPSKTPNVELPAQQLSVAAIPSQLPQHTVPVISASETRAGLSDKEKEELIEMLARLCLIE